MAVRNTESQIPGGFSKASDLGQADTSADNRYALVASLSEPLRNLKRRSAVEALTGEEDQSKKRNNTKNWIQNTYVVFVDTDQVAAPNSYTWKLKFYTGESHTLFFEDQKPTTDGVFDLDTDQWEQVKCGSKLSRIKIEVEMEGVVEKLSLEQEVVDSLDDIEALVMTKSKLSIAGTPQTTRLIANRYREYLVGEGDAADPSTVPAQLVSAIVFLKLLDISASNTLQDGFRVWGEYINEGAKSVQLASLPLGIAQIRPPILALFYPPTAPPDLTPFVWDQSGSKPYESYATQITNRFMFATTGQQIDIYNLLRFPKSAIEMCRLLLQGLRNRHSDWMNQSWDQTLGTEDAILTIVSDYDKGPRAQLPKPTRFAKKVFEIVSSPFIAGIPGGSLCRLLRTAYVGVIPTSTNRYEVEVLEQLERAKSVTALLAINETPGHARYDVNVTAEMKDGPNEGTIGYLFYHYTHQGASNFSFSRVNSFECEEIIAEDDVTKAIAMQKAWLNVLKRAVEKCPNAQDHVALAGVGDILVELDAWLALMNTWSTVISNVMLPLVPMGTTRTLTYDAEAFCPGFWESEKPLYKQTDVTPLRLQFKHDRPTPAADQASNPEERRSLLLAETLEATLTTPAHLDDRFAQMRAILKEATVKLRLVGRGYADKSFVGSTGGAEYNLKLSQRRVDWVSARIPADIRKELVGISFEACGDRLAEPPDVNPAYKDVRMLLVPDGSQ